MKTKKEKLLKETYDKFIQISISDLSMEGLEEFVDQKIMGYGTTVDEKVLTIDDYRKLVLRQREQGKGIKMTFGTTPVIHRMGNNGNSALFVDEILLSIHIENNPIELLLRITTILEYRAEKWVVIHWHGSKPEYEEGETDTWHISEWKNKTEELERLVDEKTSDLIVKNRELEIEAALERVRAVAMGMDKPEDLLNICESSFKEFQKLGFDGLRNAVIHIPNDEQNYFMDYDYSDFVGGTISKIKYGMHPVVDEYLKKIRSAKDAFFEVVIDNDQMKGWKKFRKKSGQNDDPRLDDATELYYYLFSIGIGDIGISTFKSINKTQIKVLKKFRNVFDLAYKRFNDITLAKAQAHESQIEATLERVRSRSLAMYKSDELNDVVTVLFEKLKELQIPVTAVGITIYIEGSKDMNVYVCGDIGDGVAINNYLLPYFNHPIANDLYDVHKKELDYFVGNYSKEEKNSFYKYVLKLPGLIKLPDEIKNMIMQSQSYSITMAPVKHSMINVNDFEGKPLSENEADIVKRFAKAFDQAYTRFLDLQKAEAQAREAQIELALERVRARSMAMHSSIELKDVIQIIFDRLAQLSINAEHAGIVVDYKAKANWNFWIAETQDIPSQVTVPYLDSLWDRQFTEAKEKGKDFFATQLNFEEKNSFYEELLKHVPGLTKKARNFYLGCPGLAISTVIQDDIGLYIENFSGTPYSDEDNTTLKRFGQVFQQTYTRFLDLQKAEAQTREALIEAALERVRAKSMAMHKSEELADLSLELVKQVQALGVATWFCAFNIYDDDPQGSLEWGSNGQGTFPKYRTPREGVFLRYYEAGQSGETLLINEIGENECPGHYDYLCSLPGVGEQLLKMKDAGIPFPTSQIDHAAFLKYGYILFITFEPAPEAHDIFKRFANVFEQTYTRFLDLKKAEAQAREAQIENALEKVRSRTMAMQQSVEMPEVANNLFLQVKELGFPAWSAGYCIWENDKNSASCSMSSEGVVQKSFSFPTIGEGYNFLSPLKNGEKFYVAELGGKELVEHYKFMQKLPVVGEILDGILSEGFDLPTFQIFHIVYFKHGYLMFITYEPVLEAHDIFKRFAKVFEQTYIRFLDLQNAEAQAREAQIEVALERARTQSMLMQHSDELNRTSQVFHEQLQILGVDSEFSYLWLPDEKKAEHLFWATWQDDQKHSTSFRNRQVTYPLDKTEPSIAACFVAWESGNVVHINYVAPTEVEDYFATWTELLHGIEKFNPELFAEGLYYVDAYMKYGCFGIVTRKLLTESEQQILSRFTKEFERAYTRFLSLQKAEAQAREVQIELSLERIRAQALAMNESSDLLDIVVTMRTEFVALGHEAHYFWHMRWQPEIYEKAMTSGDGTRVGMVMDLPRGFHANAAMIEWEKNDEPVAVFPYDAEGAVDYVDRMIQTGDFHKIDHNAPGPDDIRAIGGLTFIMARTTHGEIGFSLPGVVTDPPAEDLATLVRFASAFDLAYRRFEDLKEAEAQVREAQIEAALERVRSKAMAMHSSEDLALTIDHFFQELKNLNVKPIRCGVGIKDGSSRIVDVTVTSATENGEDIKLTGKLSLGGHPKLDKVYEALQLQAEYFPVLHGEEINEYYQAMNPGIEFPNFSKDDVQYGYYFHYKEGGIFAWTEKELLEDEINIFRRFKSVLSLTYRRYMDLKESEAQAKEAQIEAALERIRSRAMAMHTSDELVEVANELRNQMGLLGQKDLEVCAIHLYEENDNYFESWGAIRAPGEEGKIFQGNAEFPKSGIEIVEEMMQQYESGSKDYILINDGEKGAEWLEAMKKYSPQAYAMIAHTIENIPADELIAYWSVSDFEGGALVMVTYSQPDEKSRNLLSRASTVFGLAYRRYIDLKQAEAQAREAKIEAALERVRSKAMAMHSSDDLAITVDTFFTELNGLNVKPHRCGVGIVNAETHSVDVHATTTTQKNEIKKIFGELKLTGHPVLEKIFETWEKQEEYHPVLRGNEILEYYKVMNPQITFPDFAGDEIQFGYYFYFKEGGVFAWADNEFGESELQIFRRYTSVLSLTYRRYIDLKDAEAQAREAQIEASLERVRARTMAMHKSNELAQTAAHLFEQLNELGIKPYRCNIAIVDTDYHKIKLWSTTNSGNVIPTATSIPLDEYSVFVEMYEGWKSQSDNHVIKLTGKDRLNWTEYITKYIPFDEYKFKNLSEDTLLNESAIFSNFYFRQGFFVIHTKEEISEEDFNIIQRFANVFEQTYTRFHDLENAELQNKIIQAENERKTQELEEARELQLSMLPKELPQLKNYEIAVYMQTATEVGGDYYDFNVDDDGTLTAVIGDATGHGMRAGTIVTITKSLFNSLGSGPNILKTFKKISQVIKDMKFRQLSMCLMMLKISGNKLLLSSAAMPPALIYRKNEKTVEEIVSNGMPLGAMINFPYKLEETKVKTGDTIFLMSDGFPELMNEKKGMYGYDKVKSKFLAIAEKSPNEIIDSLKKSASEWVNGNDPDDDVTFVVIKVK